LHAQGDSHGSCDANGGSAADHHGSDGVGNLKMVRAGDIDFFARQAGLIDHYYA
jgi:hypothetical protein